MENDKYAQWRKKKDGTLFPAYLNVNQTWELMDVRFGLSRLTFYQSYRKMFPFEYFAIRAGKPAMLRISFERANEVIDQILNGDMPVETALYKVNQLDFFSQNP